MSVKAHMSDGVWKVCKATKQPCPLRDFTEHRYFEDTQEMNTANEEIVEKEGKDNFGILPKQEFLYEKDSQYFNDIVFVAENMVEEGITREQVENVEKEFLSTYDFTDQNEAMEELIQDELRAEGYGKFYEPLKVEDNYTQYQKDIIFLAKNNLDANLTREQVVNIEQEFLSTYDFSAQNEVMEELVREELSRGNTKPKSRVDFSNPEKARKFSKEFAKQYDFLYEADVNNQYVAGSNEALEYFDNNLTADEKETLVGYMKHRKDPVSSDREAIAFMFAIDNYED